MTEKKIEKKITSKKCDKILLIRKVEGKKLTVVSETIIKKGIILSESDFIKLNGWVGKSKQLQGFIYKEAK